MRRGLFFPIGCLEVIGPLSVVTMLFYLAGRIRVGEGQHFALQKSTGNVYFLPRHTRTGAYGQLEILRLEGNGKMLNA